MSISPSLKWTLASKVLSPIQGLKPWQQILAVVGGFVSTVAISYIGYWWYNYRQLFLLDSPIYVKPIEDLTHLKITPEFRLRVINLDGAFAHQPEFMETYKPQVIDIPELGPGLRIDCTFRQFWEFERALTEKVGSPIDDDHLHRPLLTFYGSNDFHHLALPLIRSWRTPFNLVIFDNHPDWFYNYPGMHCGCWFTQAVSLPTVQQAFHFGGASGEFHDDWGFHPWKELISGKIAVFPTHSTFTSLQWPKVKYQEPIRSKFAQPITEKRVRSLLLPFEEQLSKYPLYITLDKDCLIRPDNYQNWNDGALLREELMIIIKVLIELSGGKLLAMDVTGEFTKVEVQGIYRSYLHQSQHHEDQNKQDQTKASQTNQTTNLTLMKTLHEILGVVQGNNNNSNNNKEGEQAPKV